jgi:putative phage-type endonuclease
MLLSELEEPEDITDQLIFNDEPSIFEEDEIAIELVETAMHLMDEYIISEPEIILETDFHDILLEEIQDIFYIQIEEKIETSINGEDIEDDMNEILKYAVKIYIAIFYPDKFLNINFLKEEYDNKFHEFDLCEVNTQMDVIVNEEINIIEQKIQKLREIPQPVQRTPEWYKFRWNLITASNAWKALGTQATINQIIYEKCQPLKESIEGDSAGEEKEVKMVNTNSPLHWGQKYEPLTVMVYEDNYATKVEDFGCIQHDKYKFLGASPDGIVVNKESDRYGRMLEIKNVVSREITGIPKKEYWTQMQLQMEVCDLDECDFLETKFIEYPDYNAFKTDSLDDNENMCLSKDGKFKGEIIHFHTKDGNPYYVYKPLNYKKQQDIDEWENNMIEKYENEPYNYIYIKTLYWKLEVLSCILVLRDRDWFKNNIVQLEDVWKTVEKERITGYEHRAPKKRKMEYYTKPFVEKESQGCLLKFNKIIKVEQESNVRYDV